MAVAEEVTVVLADKVVPEVLAVRVVILNTSPTLLVETTVTMVGIVVAVVEVFGVYILICTINAMTTVVVQFITATDINTPAVAVEVPVAQEELAVPEVPEEMVKVITNLNLMDQVVQLELAVIVVLVVLAEVRMLVPEELAVLADKVVPEVLVETVELSVITEVLETLGQLVQLETLVLQETTETMVMVLEVLEVLQVPLELEVQPVELEVITSEVQA